LFVEYIYMRLHYLILVSCFFSINCYAQQTIGVQGGLAICTNDHANTTKTNSFSLSYEKRLSSRYFIGGMVAYNKYSFDEAYANDDYRKGSIGVNHNSDYLFVAPTFGVAVGKHMHVHFYLVPALGILVAASESVKEGFAVWEPGLGTPPTYSDTVYNNNSKVNKAIFRLGFTMQKQIPLSKYVMFTISASYNYMFSKIADVHHVYDTGTSDPYVKANLFSVLFGVSYQFHKKEKSSNETH